MVIAWTGTDFQQHINIASSNNTTSIKQKIKLNESSIDGPGVAFGNGTILLGWTGTDLSNHINTVSSNSVLSFNSSPNKQTLIETSHFGPAVTFGNGLFFVAWIDSNHHINIRSSNDGINFSDIDKVILDETSNARPAFSHIDGNLYLLWIGQDINNSINISKSTDNGKTFTDKIILKDSSDYPPHLASNNGILFLAWTGRDILRRLNEDTAEEDIGISGIGKGNKLTFSDSSIAAPSLSKYNGNIFISWTGTDIQQHINIATLSTDRVVQRIKGVLKGGVFGGPLILNRKMIRGK